LDVAFELNGNIFLEENDELHLEQLYGNMILFVVKRGLTFPFKACIPFNLETFIGGELKTL
jgi:hypothetical protein